MRSLVPLALPSTTHGDCGAGRAAAHRSDHSSAAWCSNADGELGTRGIPAASAAPADGVDGACGGLYWQVALHSDVAVKTLKFSLQFGRGAEGGVVGGRRAATTSRSVSSSNPWLRM